MPHETETALKHLRDSLPYLEVCTLEQFRRELIVQAFDGASSEERDTALEAAELELEQEAREL